MSDILMFGGLLFWNYTSKCPESSWATLWGSWSIILNCNEPEITGHFFFKLIPKSYVIYLIFQCLVGFYFETTHQNVLKLLGWPCGVLNYRPAVKWAWNNRAFSFKSYPKSYVICLILECLVGFYFESKYHNGRTLPLIVFAFIDCLFVCTRRMLLL